jgi:hypothetical protein
LTGHRSQAPTMGQSESTPAPPADSRVQAVKAANDKIQAQNKSQDAPPQPAISTTGAIAIVRGGKHIE